MIAGPADGNDDGDFTVTPQWSGSPDHCVGSSEVPGAAANSVGIVWPDGTQWDGDSSQVLLVGGSRRVSMGESFQAIGGLYSASTATADSFGLTTDVLHAVMQCGWNEFIYVQSLG